MLTKFKTSYGEIVAVDVLRETEQCVYLPSARHGRHEHREAKITDYHRYHDSWEDAHAYLLDRARKVLANALDAVVTAEKKLANVQAMTKPHETKGEG